MLILADTSVLVWWMHNDERLGQNTRKVLEDGSNQVIISSISILEYSIKARLKKLPRLTNLKYYIEKQGFFTSGFTALQADQVFDLPELSWKDPFDLAIIAHAKTIQAILLTADKKMLAELDGFIICHNARK